MHYNNSAQSGAINEEKEDLIIKYADYDTFKTYVLNKYDQIVNDINYEKNNIHYYAIKRIKFINRDVPILLQNKNGSCPLLCISNILLLRNQLNIQREITRISQKTIEKKIMNVILESNKKNVLDSTTSCNFRKNIIECVEVLPQLKYGLDLNCKFTDVQAFEYTKGLCIFDMLNIPLYHGWVVTSDNSFFYPYLKDYSYNVIINKIIRFNEYFEKKKESKQELGCHDEQVNCELIESTEGDKRKWKRMESNLRKLRIMPFPRGNWPNKAERVKGIVKRDEETKAIIPKSVHTGEKKKEGNDKLETYHDAYEDTKSENITTTQNKKIEDIGINVNHFDIENNGINSINTEKGVKSFPIFPDDSDKQSEGGLSSIHIFHKQVGAKNTYVKAKSDGIEYVDYTSVRKKGKETINNNNENKNNNNNDKNNNDTNNNNSSSNNSTDNNNKTSSSNNSNNKNKNKKSKVDNVIHKNIKRGSSINKYEMKQNKATEKNCKQKMKKETEELPNDDLIRSSNSYSYNRDYMQQKEKNGRTGNKKEYRSTSNECGNMHSIKAHNSSNTTITFSNNIIFDNSDIIHNTVNKEAAKVPIFPDELVSNEDAAALGNDLAKLVDRVNLMLDLPLDKKTNEKEKNVKKYNFFKRNSENNSNKDNIAIISSQNNVDKAENNNYDISYDKIILSTDTKDIENITCIDNNTDKGNPFAVMKNYEDEINLTPYEIHEGFVMSEFLEFYKTQLTVEGLKLLQKSVNANQLVAFFRNNHFSTLFKYKNKLFLLATDHSFLHLNCSWELFDNVENDTSYYDCNFEPLSPQRNLYRHANYSVTYSNHYEINNNKNVYCVERQNSSNSSSKDKRKKKKKKCNFM